MRANRLIITRFELLSYFCGYLAACAVSENFSDPDKAAAEYKRSTAPLHTYMERQWRFVGSIAGTFSEMNLNWR